MDKKQLVALLKKTIREEVKKCVKQMVKEEVKSAVNEILAEQFLRTLNANKGATLGETFQVEAHKQNSREKQLLDKAKEKQISENRKQHLLKKLGVDEDPALAYFYEGTDPIGAASAPDGDDEGVDLSVFGY